MLSTRDGLEDSGADLAPQLICASPIICRKQWPAVVGWSYCTAHCSEVPGATEYCPLLSRLHAALLTLPALAREYHGSIWLSILHTMQTLIHNGQNSLVCSECFSALWQHKAITTLAAE